MKHILLLVQLQDFIQRYGPGWVACDGSSCAGSTYAQQTNNQNVPNLPLTFIRIN